ncbi:EAL domain-containing protein [Pandoraea horticolens]|nr:cyclic diguanylate phosphodiesterase [Pandoraea horticolens]
MLAAAGLPLLIGLAVSFWHAHRVLHADAASQAQRTLGHIDRMLGNARDTALRVGPRAGMACEDVVLELREQVNSVLFVRSVDLLTNDNEVYCSSLYGNYHGHLDLTAYVDGHLRIAPHSGTQPDATLLVYRNAIDGRGAIVTIDGRHVRDVLSLLDREDVLLSIQVGDVTLGPNGIIDMAVAHTPDTVLRSEQFPVSVLATIPAGTLPKRVVTDYSGVIGVCAMFGLVLVISIQRASKHVRVRQREMVRAMEHGEFVPYLQPLVNAADARWVGAEVLVRWHHPTEGIIPPNNFIPLAESSALITPITRALFRAVAEKLALVNLPKGFRLSFNVSPQHLTDASIISDCDALLAMLGEKRVQIVLELTERELLAAQSETRRILEALHSRGIKIAIDDFGTGHSSLGYLRDFDMDAVKIDQSFVEKIGADPLAERVLESILELAAKLELITIAEGVETTEQRNYLSDRGVPLLQGFLFGRPSPIDAFIVELQSRSAAAST